MTARWRYAFFLGVLLTTACTPLNESSPELDAGSDLGAAAGPPADGSPSVGAMVDGPNADPAPMRLEAGVSVAVDAVGPADAGPFVGDTGGGAMDAGGVAVDAAPSDAGPFTCTRVIGSAQASEWYQAAFETYVPDGNWELVSIHSGFIQFWADPKNPVWSAPPESHCVVTAGGPDRVIFIALLYQDLDVNTWISQLSAVVSNLKAAFPKLRRIELATFVRAPGNMPCADGASMLPLKSTISPAQDAANVTVAAANPGFVRVDPKFEVTSCGDYGGNPPHLAPAAAPVIAAKLGAYYRSSD
jgi:hypothetical protein